MRDTLAARRGGEVGRSQSMRFAGEAGPSAKKKKKVDAVFGGMFGKVGGEKRKAPPKQATLKNLWGSARERVGKAFTVFANATGVPANAAKGPWLQEFMDTVAREGPGITAPTPYDIRNKFTTMHKEDIESAICRLKEEWPKYGVTVMADGWTSYGRRQIINFLVHCNGKSIFLRSVDATGHVKDHVYLTRLLKDIIKEVGKENVVQVITDNGSNFKKAGKTIEADTRYGMFWTPCAAHCLDLILKDFGQRKRVVDAVTNARTLTTFIYNKGMVLHLMREHCKGELVRPGITRFATNYIAIRSILDNKAGLKQMVNSDKWQEMPEARMKQGKVMTDHINNTKFWDELEFVEALMSPVVYVLKLVDGDKSATLGYIYAALQMMENNIAQNVPKRYVKPYLKIVKERRDNMMSHPMHLAGK